MPTATYTPLGNITLSSTAASVTFGSISQEYTDLVLVASPITSTSVQIYSRVNGDSGSNYSMVYAAGDGSSGSSSYLANISFMAVGLVPYAQTSSNMSFTININDYSATTKQKSWLIRSGSSTNGTEMLTGRWASTSAITSLLIYPQSGNFTSGSTFALFGIAA